jgi:hypothetical protein
MGTTMKTMYCCGVDWTHEIGEAPDLEGRIPLYSSIEELKAKRTCWEECGIVEVKLELVRVVEPDKIMS